MIVGGTSVRTCVVLPEYLAGILESRAEEMGATKSEIISGLLEDFVIDKENVRSDVCCDCAKALRRLIAACALRDSLGEDERLNGGPLRFYENALEVARGAKQTRASSQE